MTNKDMVLRKIQNLKDLLHDASMNIGNGLNDIDYIHNLQMQLFEAESELASIYNKGGK